jgi:RNA polymerase sigma-70 factor, ECF subfamily
MAVAQEHAEPGFLRWVGGLVEQHRTQLVAYARGLGIDGEAALDCVQDAFCSFMELPQARALSNDADASIKLLTVVLRHIVQNDRRKDRRRAVLLGTHAAAAEPLPEAPIDRTLDNLEELARAHGCILSMRELHRRVLFLCLLEGRSSEQIAEELGVTPTYARVLLNRARKHVRHCDFSRHEPIPWQA